MESGFCIPYGVHLLGQTPLHGLPKTSLCLSSIAEHERGVDACLNTFSVSGLQKYLNPLWIVGVEICRCVGLLDELIDVLMISRTPKFLPMLRLSLSMS